MARGRRRGGESGSGVLAACAETEMLLFSLSAVGVSFCGERKGD